MSVPTIHDAQIADASEVLSASIDRLTEDNRITDNSSQLWRNAGAVGLNVFIDPEVMLTEISESTDSEYAMWTLKTDFEVDASRTLHTRIVNGQKNCLESARVPSIDRFHDNVLRIISKLPVRRADTEVTLGKYDKGHRNALAHIDTPFSSSTNLSIGRIAFITTWPGKTEFMIDGEKLEGETDYIFPVSKHGDVNDNIYIPADKFETFGDGELVVFGSRNTIHAMPIIPELQGAPRFVARSLVEIDITT